MSVYRAHPRYRILMLLCLLLVGLMAWSVWRSPELGSLFFLVISLALTVWYGLKMFTSVELLPEGIIVHPPIGNAHRVEFRQLLDVVEEGRTGRAILLHFHPVERTGMLDLEQVATLTLPAVAEQQQLLDHLLQHVPT